jgi:hypothetical protein
MKKAYKGSAVSDVKKVIKHMKAWEKSGEIFFKEIPALHRTETEWFARALEDSVEPLENDFIKEAIECVRIGRVAREFFLRKYANSEYINIWVERMNSKNAVTKNEAIYIINYCVEDNAEIFSSEQCLKIVKGLSEINEYNTALAMKIIFQSNKIKWSSEWSKEYERICRFKDRFIKRDIGVNPDWMAAEAAVERLELNSLLAASKLKDVRPKVKRTI